MFVVKKITHKKGLFYITLTKVLNDFEKKFIFYSIGLTQSKLSQRKSKI